MAQKVTAEDIEAAVALARLPENVKKMVGEAVNAAYDMGYVDAMEDLSTLAEMTNAEAVVRAAKQVAEEARQEAKANA